MSVALYGFNKYGTWIQPSNTDPKHQCFGSGFRGVLIDYCDYVDYDFDDYDYDDYDYDDYNFDYDYDYG